MALRVLNILNYDIWLGNGNFAWFFEYERSLRRERILSVAWNSLRNYWSAILTPILGKIMKCPTLNSINKELKDILEKKSQP